MLHIPEIPPTDLATRLLLDDLGKMLHSKKISMVLVDTATHGFFPFIVSSHLGTRSALEASWVIQTTGSLYGALDIDTQGKTLDNLDNATGAEMARNALERSDAQFAIAMTLHSANHLSLIPGGVILGLHWWYRDKEENQKNWMLSQTFMVTANKNEMMPKLVHVIASETLKILRLHDDAWPRSITNEGQQDGVS